MEISFSQSFLDSLKRIDNKVMIDKFKVDQGDFRLDLHLVCHGKNVQVCVEGVSGECGRLDFYYGGEIGFTIIGEGIVMNPERTIFEFNLPDEPKATIECPGLTDDTKFLEGLGPELGVSLYKDITISPDSLIWKETLGKYIVDRGIQDNHSYDVELLDTKSGILEERPIKFKSYRRIRIEQGNWEIDTIKKSVLVKHDVYSEVSKLSFLVWDSPMIDAKVNLEEDPVCIDKLGEYIDPGNIIYGNSDCFQFINYSSSLVGFRITGTEGSKVSVLMNRESTSGDYTSFDGVIGEDGTVEIRFTDLPYQHFNGLSAVGPSRVTKIETIMYLEETVDEYNPNPDKTYVVSLRNENSVVMVNGVADYIEYEKYLGEIHEIGRGTDHIDNIPGLMIESIEGSGLNYEIMDLEKQIKVRYNGSVTNSDLYAVFQVTIDNNIEVNGNIIITAQLAADYKIRIEQSGVIWKIYNSPDYINGDDGIGIYLLGYQQGATRYFEVMTNAAEVNLHPIIPEEASSIFRIVGVSYSTKVIDGEIWTINGFYIETLSENIGDTWRPKKTGTNDPCLITFKNNGEEVLYLYAIQLKKIDNPIEIWEETIIPGKFTQVKDNEFSEGGSLRSITLLNSMTKNFIVIKRSGEGVTSLNWYYYDLLGSNQFYITDSNFQTTNVGIEYIYKPVPETDILNLGIEDRSVYGRVINVNRSDVIGSIGTLVVTESSSYPGTWRDLIDNNTATVEVIRELDNIYIQVGEDEEDLKDNDYVQDIDKIGVFDLDIRSNFKYIIQTYGYFRIYPDTLFSGRSGYTLLTRKEVFSGYNDINTFYFALIELDEDSEMAESYIEIRSGSLVRKITLNVVGPKKEHDYLLYYPDEEDREVEKPNIIRIYSNGTIAPTTDNEFLYSSTTTPKIEVSGINKAIDTTDPIFFNHEAEYYGYHKSIVPITVPNSLSLTYSKYPMKSFGYIREMSQDYSDTEIIGDTGATSYLEYPLYMKGKEHFLWCVDNLSGLSNLSDPTVPDSGVVNSDYNMVIDAKGSSGKTIYVVSRYSVDNRTFITETPEESIFKVKRDELEANISISPQQSISLDKKSQIEYAIPIQVSCNVENNRGNIFLGSLEYKAKTDITEDSVYDVIEADDNIIEAEGIDETYIKSYITTNKTQNLSLNIFQLGSNKDVFDLYSSISDLGIWATSNYIIPEIGSDYTITSFEVSKGVDPYSTGEDIVTVKSEWGPKYFLVKVDSQERVRDNGSDFYWYNYLPTSLINDTRYVLSFNIQATKVGQEGSTSINLPSIEFKKYGCNYGLYVEGIYGFGCTPEDYLGKFDSSAYVSVDNEGGSIMIHAGIFYAVDGVDSTEALKVPAKYEFIGENQPLEFSWVDGNKDDDGNLRIVLPPRTRDEVGSKEYLLKVTQPHEYYPLELYVSFYQSSLRGSDLDINKEDYRLMFLDDEVNILSNGTVVNNEEGIFKFVSNLPESEFEKVTFRWRQKSEESFIPYNPDNLELEEVERSYKDGYVKFKFKPNGSEVFIDANIEACYNNRVIGKVSAKQGYFYLITEYYNPYRYYTSSLPNVTPIKNPMSRLSPNSNYLYTYSYHGATVSSRDVQTPCKSNNDNANSSIIHGRGIYKLTAKKKEYYDSREYSCDLEMTFNNSEIIFISPKNILESYGLDFIVNSTLDDNDAKVNTRFESTGYATSYNFNQYNPYIEFSYVIKDEYIRNNNIITASGKVTLKHPDTGELVDFYILSSTEMYGSNEPQDISLLKFSDDILNFDYRGGTKQVSFDPASFGSMFTLIQMPGSDWMTVTLPANSNYLSIKAAENKSKDDDPAFFRTGQLKIDVKDPRDNYIMGSFYINANQEPDIAQTSSGSGGGGGGGKVPSNIYVNVKLINSTGKQVPITGEIKMYVGGHNGIFINLPGASSSSTMMTLENEEETLEYSVNCVGNGVDPSNYLDQSIDSSVIVYAPDGGSHNSEMITATISGNSGVFSNNASYVVTLNSYDPGSSTDGVKIDLMLVNNQTTDVPIYLCGLIDFEVSNGGEGTVSITANLPVTSESSNIYSIPVGGSIGPYEVTCSGENIENYLGNSLNGNCSVKYHTTDGEIADSYYRPYSISNSNNKFEKETTYIITFNPKENKSLSRGKNEDEYVEPTQVVEEKNTK